MVSPAAAFRRAAKASTAHGTKAAATTHPAVRFFRALSIRARPRPAAESWLSSASAFVAVAAALKCVIPGEPARSSHVGGSHSRRSSVKKNDASTPVRILDGLGHQDGTQTPDSLGVYMVCHGNDAGNTSSPRHRGA